MQTENPIFVKIASDHLEEIITYGLDAQSIQPLLTNTNRNLGFGPVMKNRLETIKADFATEVICLAELIQTLRANKQIAISIPQTSLGQSQYATLQSCDWGTIISPNLVKTIFLPVVGKKGTDNLLNRLNKGQTIILAPVDLKPPESVILEFRRKPNH